MALTKLEAACINAFRNGSETPARGTSEIEGWIGFGFHILLRAGQMLRRKRAARVRTSVEIKLDGSPTTTFEQDVELLVRDMLASFDPSATLIGEESGGALPASGVALAVDPVDGTWAFVTGMGTFSTTLAVFHDRAPIVGMVLNPSMGEIGYAASDRQTRLVRLSVFGESDSAAFLVTSADDNAKVLVNLHPNRSAGSLVTALYKAWQDDRIRMVRSVGGSPSWALLEAAKGDFVYVNLWPAPAAQPWDLAAGVMLVRRAGGEVTDFEGNAIDELSHQGPFVAGTNEGARNRVIEVAREVL